MNATPLNLGQWLLQEPTSLALSSGFFGFFAHTALILELEQLGFEPAGLAGSSAGALVAGAWAAGVEGKHLAEILLALRRQDFWDPRPGLGLLRGKRFRALLDGILPVRRFEACRWPLALSVHDAIGRKTQVLDSGPLAPAIHASCAVPGLFQPVWINKRPYLDGGVSDRHGLAGVAGQPRILYHHLASRSPWRKKGSPSLALPQAPNIVSLVIHKLPRSGPFRLAKAAEVLAKTRHAVRRALQQPVSSGKVEVEA